MFMLFFVQPEMKNWTYNDIEVPPRKLTGYIFHDGAAAQKQRTFASISKLTPKTNLCSFENLTFLNGCRNIDIDLSYIHIPPEKDEVEWHHH